MPYQDILGELDTYAQISVQNTKQNRWYSPKPESSLCRMVISWTNYLNASRQITQYNFASTHHFTSLSSNYSLNAMTFNNSSDKENFT